MYGVELVEGKDHPPENGTPEYEDRGGKTVGLLLRMSKLLWRTGKVVVLDSGFCVLKGLIELKSRNLYCCSY